MKPVILSFSLLAFAGASYAQDANKSSQQRQSAQDQKSQSQSAAGGASAQSRSEMRASNIMDAKLVDAQGKEIGEVSDVVIDLQKDRVHAVVVEFGGFLGVGAKQFAFPMSEVKPGQGQDQLTVNVDKQKLESAQGFAKEQWPGMDDQFWGRVGQGGGQQGGKLNLVRASKMIGAQVQDKSGKPVGEVRDAVVSLSDGQLQNLVIDMNEGGGQASVPAKGLSSGTDNKLVLDMDRDQIRAQAKKNQPRAEGAQGAATGSTAQQQRSGQRSGQPAK
jgi:sporulation protein YlmC with PRC-barrel domain